MEFGWIVRVAALLLAMACGRVETQVSNTPTQDDRLGSNQRETAMQVTKPSDHEIVLMREFDAPRETVFAALTQAEHLRAWMEPTDTALVTCEVDVRAGGSLRYVFERPNGRKIEVRGIYEVVDPPQQLIYTETYDFSPLKVRVTTTLNAVNGTTGFRQTLRYQSKQERDEDFRGVATSAQEGYAKLAHYLAQIQR